MSSPNYSPSASSVSCQCAVNYGEQLLNTIYLIYLVIIWLLSNKNEFGLSVTCQVFCIGNFKWYGWSSH